MNTKRRLHIGGTQQSAGWEILNIQPLNMVDHVGNANDLSRFNDHSFAHLYVSHVLEHFDYKELATVLGEWHRVLTPGGRIDISVPDFDRICRLFLQKGRLSAADRVLLMKMIYGGHIDQYDYHLVGFTEEFLASYLTETGFEEIFRVENFGLFDDDSMWAFKGVPISLNVSALKTK